ncbi:hypothetical protein SprV_0100399200 [Sparganum proliferum]
MLLTGSSEGALRESDGVEFAPGHRLTDLDYADDVALLASSFGDLQSMVSRVKEVAKSLSKICTKERICSRGRFGEVWFGKMTLAVDVDSQSSSSQPSTRVVDVAIKVFLTSEKRSWETELELYRLPRLPHPNILHYIGVDVVPRNESTDEDDSYSTGNGAFECWLVTDFLPLGSVYDYIRSTELSWGEMLRIAIGMARGLSHLHTELPHTAFQEGKPSIAHRDFKSRNVLLKSDLTACISDMGLAIILESGKCIGDAHLQVLSQLHDF